MLIFGLFFASCSSVPNFKPEKPIESAENFEEALSLCKSYQIEVLHDQNGALKKSKVVTLVPWIRCFETIFQHFQEAKQSQTFVLFFRNLQLLHDSTEPGQAEVLDAVSLNLIVNQIIGHIINGDNNYSSNLLELTRKQLPDFAMYLISQKNYQSNPAPLANLKTKNLAKKTLNAEQKKYCTQYRSYLVVDANQKDLSQYQLAITDQLAHSNLAVSNKNLLAQQARIQKRIDSLGAEVQTYKKSLTQTLAHIQSQQPWFSNDYCLVAGGWFDRQ